MARFDFNNDELIYGQYLYLGHQEGDFKPQDSTEVTHYKNVFLAHQQDSNSNRTIHGYVCEKFRLRDVSCVADLVPGDLVHVFFDQYGRVNSVMKI